MLKIVEFVSRNKDNQGLIDFKPRTRTLIVTDKNAHHVDDEFKAFVEQGVYQETSRMYETFNELDPVGANRALAHFLIDHPDATPDKVQRVLKSELVKHTITKHWLFDVDMQVRTKDEVVAFINDLSDNAVIDVRDTKSGYAVVTEHGFDVRALTKRYPDIEVKRTNGSLYVTSRTKVWS